MPETLPKELTGLEKVEALAQGAPTVERVVHPLVMIDDKKVLPRDYLIHLRSQRCLNCGTIHEWSDVYARNEIPPLHNMGHYVNNLVPIQNFRFNLPVRIVRIEARAIPVCHECFDQVSLTHLPDPRSTDEWKAIVRRKATQAEAAAVKAKPKSTTPKAKPSLDSMKDLL